ncbi:MAG TPA: hypothetical protein DHW61_08575 [Lachnoclostridium phytofermentans]|uniref:histidine kinase n=1 Tax=Lachnoclostridium phytofermentans TaxID=66219 RepID=A0A3D2X655_9FIRM|nr:histidine kinase [Lachnoclostridium sp.]HCL02456.1 hypothetical protein [Lachnoclostridium phytofermentans]
MNVRKAVQAIKRRINIRTKIIFLYLSVLILSFTLSVGIFRIIHQKSLEREVGDAAMQTVNALKGNLNFIFDNVNQFSTLIYFDRNVQNSLKNIDSASIDPHIHQTIQSSLVNMLLSGDYISSVFIFDIYNNYYYSHKIGPISVNKDKVYQTNWFQDLKQNKGEPMFISKSEDIIQFITRPDHNYISLVREISDVDDYSPLATLLLTIDEKTIQKYFDEVGKQYNSQYCIVDSKGNYVIYPSNYDKTMDEYFLMEQEVENGYEVCHANSQSVILARQNLNIHDWKLVGMLPISDNMNLSEYYKSSILLIIGLNFIFVFVCSLVLTKLIFHPLSKVQKQMEMVERGEFIEMPINPEQTDEISQLKRVFNQMVRAIIDLIHQVKKEEKIIAQGELQLLQAQINPHFLYNTLDAVSALALIEDHENCLKMTQALGNFYRNSLNSGQDLVTVDDEQSCIESYVTILNIRYDNKVTLVCDIEHRIKKEPILKLILQPIVENAVHHGIRNKEGQGTIHVKGYLDEEDIIFIITDDGVGMSEERIKQILEGKTKTGKSGFGLYSSIQRIALFYDVKNPMTIHSEVGIGTEVILRVKKIQGIETGK